jgi:hypothetical protein
VGCGSCPGTARYLGSGQLLKPFIMSSPSLSDMTHLGTTISCARQSSPTAAGSPL